MLSHFALVDTGNLSLSSAEANGIMGKTSRIIKENAGINYIRKKKKKKKTPFCIVPALNLTSCT